jgi:hypothetical protein
MPPQPTNALARPANRYFFTSLRLYFAFSKPYAARVAFICLMSGDSGRSVSGPAPPSIFCLTRRIDDPNHPRGGIASHPGCGCRIFSRSRKKSSTNEIVAKSSNIFTSELGVRCIAWSIIHVNNKIIPTITSMEELPITSATSVRTIRSPIKTSKVCGPRLHRSRRNSPSCRALQLPLLGWEPVGA